MNLERVERRVVERALALHAWNISLAARELGLSRAALYRRSSSRCSRSRPSWTRPNRGSRPTCCGC
ncbi:helix-turn-helix domain-containing protein [Piscinibacter sakaiensis]|uniref:helix-turn-helix domain-containing protein n=1 Tax=Piscinibacter sakaiensis TaxID=1547922 RepID=UPI00372A86EC